MRTRGTTKQRGYSGQHQRIKEQWRPIVSAGQGTCHAIICLEERDGRTRWIQPGTPWHLGHNAERTAWTGPEHQRCNTADGARRKNKAQGARGKPPRLPRWYTSAADLRTSRQW